MFGLNLLSNGLQKVAGDGMRRILAAMTSNPFTQILTGIGVIMGANIGTTITAWILAVFGFSFHGQIWVGGPSLFT